MKVTGYRIDPPIEVVQKMMDEVTEERRHLMAKWDAFHEVLGAFQRQIAKHYECDSEKEMKEAMKSDFNPYSTFSVKKKKRKHV